MGWVGGVEGGWGVGGVYRLVGGGGVVVAQDLQVRWGCTTGQDKR